MCVCARAGAELDQKGGLFIACLWDAECGIVTLHEATYG